jgi:hypothetical protein
MADNAMRQWLIRLLTGRPKCVCVEAGEPCPWLGTVTVTFYSQMGVFSVQTCHWHAGALARNDDYTVRRSDEALMAQRREEWFGGNP